MKLNAEQIKKELEGLAVFKICPEYIKNALALINEQEQKIKELTGENEKFCGVLEITDDDVIAETTVSLTDLIWEAYKKSLQEGIRANTVMISKRLAKVNGFTRFFGNGYGDFPPLICGLEAYVTDELPDEFAFGLFEAPSTQKEHVFETGRKGGYMEAVLTMQDRLTLEFDRMHKNNFMTPEVRQWIIDQIAKEMLEGNNDQETDEK